jgi:hypothetical protein
MLCSAGNWTVQSAEYFAYLQKAGEYALKAREESEPSTKRGLEEASKEYLRRAALANTEKQRT